MRSGELSTAYPYLDVFLQKISSLLVSFSLEDLIQPSTSRAKPRKFFAARLEIFFTQIASAQMAELFDFLEDICVEKRVCYCSHSWSSLYFTASMPQRHQVHWTYYRFQYTLPIDLKKNFVVIQKPVELLFLLLNSLLLHDGRHITGEWDICEIGWDIQSTMLFCSIGKG